MTLWIRSQDRKDLILIDEKLSIGETHNRATLENKYLIKYKDLILGEYATEERALEVLDEIQDIIISTSIIPLENNDAITCGSAKVYEMPEE